MTNLWRIRNTNNDAIIDVGAQGSTLEVEQGTDFNVASHYSIDNCIVPLYTSLSLQAIPIFYPLQIPKT
jgi:hypothetical protein